MDAKLYCPECGDEINGMTCEGCERDYTEMELDMLQAHEEQLTVLERLSAEHKRNMEYIKGLEDKLSKNTEDVSDNKMPKIGEIIEYTSMTKTVNDLIKELSSLKPELRKLPVCIKAENGMLLEPEIKKLFSKEACPFEDDPEKIILTW